MVCLCARELIRLEMVVACACACTFVCACRENRGQQQDQARWHHILLHGFLENQTRIWALKQENLGRPCEFEADKRYGGAVPSQIRSAVMARYVEARDPSDSVGLNEDLNGEWP